MSRDNDQTMAKPEDRWRSEFRQRWKEMLLSGEPTEREACEHAVRSIYQAGSRDTPEIHWVDSPLELVKQAAAVGRTDNVNGLFWYLLHYEVCLYHRSSWQDEVFDPISEIVRERIWEAVRAELGFEEYGQIGRGDSPYPSWRAVQGFVWDTAWDSSGSFTVGESFKQPQLCSLPEPVKSDETVGRRV
jgi:hypothetical protein